MVSKLLISYIAIILVVVSYTPYIVDTIKGKTTPHMYSWLIWSILSFTTTSLYFYNGGGSGTLVQLISFLLTLLIFILSIFKGHKDITKSDKMYLGLSLTAFLLWIVVDTPVLSAILGTFTSLFALLPTVRKSWDLPHSETLSTYIVNSVRHVLILLSISTYSIITVINPALWALANTSVAILLIFRRRVGGKAI